MSTQDLFWLHVPIETTRGDWLKPPPDGRITVLGKSARLLERDLPRMNSLTSSSAAVIKQWLLFEPMTEDVARQILTDLRAKIPALAFRQRAAFRVAASELYVAPYPLYNGLMPTLVPSKFVPNPAWASTEMTSYLDGAHLLGAALNDTPSIADARLSAALELEIASRYDVLPRSIFLAQLTILDSLAVRFERADHLKAWIDEKVSEARCLGDDGLISSLQNLKQASHGAAVRALISRAAIATGASPEEQTAKTKLAGRLYNVRSAMSHTDASEGLDVQGARDLVSMVLQAAIADLGVLDPAAFSASRQPDVAAP